MRKSLSSNIMVRTCSASAMDLVRKKTADARSHKWRISAVTMPGVSVGAVFEFVCSMCAYLVPDLEAMMMCGGPSSESESDERVEAGTRVRRVEVAEGSTGGNNKGGSSDGECSGEGGNGLSRDSSGVREFNEDKLDECDGGENKSDAEAMTLLVETAGEAVWMPEISVGADLADARVVGDRVDCEPQSPKQWRRRREVREPKLREAIRQRVLFWVNTVDDRSSRTSSSSRALLMLKKKWKPASTGNTQDRTTNRTTVSCCTESGTEYSSR